MVSSHITNKAVSKQKVLHPMGYMVIIMPIGYNMHDKYIFMIVSYYILYL